MLERLGYDYQKEPKLFYRGLITASDGSNIVWFASQGINEIVSQLDDLFLHMDGTFKKAPRFAEQLFIISAQVYETVCSILNYYLYKRK